jgi:AcrR family transcriptional regulator
MAHSESETVADAVRQRIVAGARRHFLAHGFRGVTMDDVAHELGMSKKTLYAHFPSKIALLQAAVLDKFAAVETELAQIASNSAADFPAALHQLLECLQRHTAEPQPVFVRDLQREAPEVFQLVETRRAALIQRYFGKFFVEGRRAGMIRKDVPTEMIIEILLAAIQAIVNPPKLGELGLSVKSGIAAIITVVLEGVLTGPGRSQQ